MQRGPFAILFDRIQNYHFDIGAIIVRQIATSGRQFVFLFL